MQCAVDASKSDKAYTLMEFIAIRKGLLNIEMAAHPWDDYNRGVIEGQLLALQGLEAGILSGNIVAGNIR